MDRIWPALLAFLLSTLFTIRYDAHKQKREARNKLLTSIGDAHDMAIKYWGQNDPQESTVMGALLSSKLQEIELELQKQKTKNSIAVTKALIDFRQASTDGDFQSAHRQAETEGSDRLSRIVHTKIQFIEALK